MTREQVNEEFAAIVDRHANKRAANQLDGLLDLANEIGPWPDDEAPKLVGRLWK
jgi:hypothetical protein